MVNLREDVGKLPREELDDDTEKKLFNLSFRRQFQTRGLSRDMRAMYADRMSDILIGAEIAKKKFSQALGGECPEPSQFQMTRIDSHHMCLDDWDLASVTGGAVANWLHAGTTILGGTGGNAMAIGKAMVLSIIAVGTNHPSPKCNAIEFDVDGKPYPRIFTSEEFRNSDFPVKELDYTIHLFHPRTFVARVFFGLTGIDSLRLIGAAFQTEARAREIDPASQTGIENLYHTT